jgi:hypothetical protein
LELSSGCADGRVDEQITRSAVPPERIAAAAVERQLAVAGRRLRAREMLRAMAGAAVAVPLLQTVLMRAGLGSVGAIAIAIAVCATVAAIWLLRRRSRWQAPAAARALEAALPASRNLVITAEELLRHPDRASPRAGSRVLVRAAEVLDEASGVHTPIRRDAILTAIAIGLGIAIAGGLANRAAVAVRESVQQALESAASPTDPILTATITPPGYTGEPPRTLERPERIEALQGSRLQLTFRAGAAPSPGWRVRFGNQPLQSTETRDGFSSETILAESGYLAIEARGENALDRRLLVPVAVAPDRAPTITIEAPGKDLLVPDSKPTVPVTASASDDHGLQTLDLRYTRVSGSGEQFEFTEGSIPLPVARETGRSWKAHASIALATLGLEPGDSLIYRVVGRDRRPGDAGLSSSDTYFIEVAGPGQVALAGFELPPDRERYALSQQMIVLKLERLKAREGAMARATLEEEMAAIAAEQRAVRAHFVFLMGGEVEDEEDEAAHSHEIQEGRLENTARREIGAAIQHMSRAEQGMAVASTAAALPQARAAVEALQRAFDRNRYFLRTLPVRSRVDPKRRMTGELSGASDWRRALVTAVPDSPNAAARSLLTDVLEIAAGISSGTAPPATLTTLAERAIAVDPSSSEWQGISRNLQRLRDAGDSAADRAKLLTEVVSAMTAVITREAVRLRPADRDDSSLRSAWSEERRRQ